MIVTRRATPARITLGVTTVLTITTLKANADSNLPHTSYPKVKTLKPELINIALTYKMILRPSDFTSGFVLSSPLLP